MKKIYIPILLLISLSLFAATMPATDDVYSILQKMNRQIKKVKGLKYKTKQIERIDGRLIEQKLLVKFNRVHFSIYAKQLEGGTEGLELLYRKGWNNNKALVNTNGFPWVNINLNPYGNQMRKDQHHTILDLGFELFGPVTESLLNRYGAEINSMGKNKGARTFEGRQVWEIEVENANYRWVDYMVKKGESLLDIAAANQVSEHMIMSKNKGVDSYTDVSSEQTIKIPTEYGSKILLFIDQETYLPLVIKIYDHQGLFEHYEFLNLELNPSFSTDEFSENFKDYGF